MHSVWTNMARLRMAGEGGNIAQKTITVDVKMWKRTWACRWAMLILWVIDWKHWGGGLRVGSLLQLTFSTSVSQDDLDIP